MVTITRKNNVIRDELRFCNADGTEALTVPVDLNIDVIANRVNKAYELLGHAQNVLQENPHSEEAQTAYGEAVLGVFAIVFGDKGCEDILAFYDNNYSEMLLDLFPFINDTVMPRVRELSAARKQQLLELAKMK